MWARQAKFESKMKRFLCFHTFEDSFHSQDKEPSNGKATIFLSKEVQIQPLSLDMISWYGKLYHMAKAVLLMGDKYVLEGGLLIEYKAWKVPVSKDYPEGIKYSFYAVNEKEKRILVGYDNHQPKSHHRHWNGREEPYTFEGIEKLKKDFLKDVETILHQGEQIDGPKNDSN